MTDRVLMSWQDLDYGLFMIQLELAFAHELDAERLRHAIDLTLDTEPVLGCRAVTNGRTPFWQRLAPDERHALAVVTDPAELDRFRCAAIDARTGPLLKCCLLNSGGGSRLLVKVSHLPCDTGGLKDVASTLSATYRRLLCEPGHRPMPNVNGRRDLMQVTDRLHWLAYPLILFNYCHMMWSNRWPVPTLTLPVRDCPRGPAVLVLRHLPKERVSHIHEYGRLRGATLNDVFLAAFHRALAGCGNWDRRSMLRLMHTLDLRRWYLPSGKTGGVCNFSMFEYTNLGTEPGRDFPETLRRVRSTTRRRKASLPGLTEILHGPPMAVMPYRRLVKVFKDVIGVGVRSGNIPNALTNLGNIEPQSVSFDHPPETAHVVCPPIFPPLFGAGLSGYRGTLTLSAGTVESAKGKVEELFDGILEEIPK
jgi:NRPS condensation-like uncharacterized protein